MTTAALIAAVAAALLSLVAIIQQARPQRVFRTKPPATRRLINIGHLKLDMDTPEGHCAMCTREIPGDEMRLETELRDNATGERYRLLACRPCLGEHAPDMLAELEAAYDAS